jgi:HNH endonuclease
VTTRATISTRLRFEVFKRDKFTCQYCGEKAPEVILHVDHVEPVAKGGTTDLLNLVTACGTCNLGKGPRRLKDGSIVEAQRLQAEALQVKHEQLAMLAAWHRGLAQLDQTGTDEAQAFWSDLTGSTLAKRDLGTLRRLIRRYGLGEVLEAMRVAVDEYGKHDADGLLTTESVETSWQKVGGVCYVRRQEADDPGVLELFYTRGILRKRFHLTGYRLAEVLGLLRRGRKVGFSSEDQQIWAKNARSYDNWYAEELKAIEQAEAGEEERPVPSWPQVAAPDPQELEAGEDLDEEEPDEEEQRRLEEEERAWMQAQEEEQREEEEREHRAEVAREFWSNGGRDRVTPEPRPEDAAPDPPKAPWCCRACGQWIPAMSAIVEIMHAPEGGPVGGYPKGQGAAGEAAGDEWGLIHSDITIYALHPECLPEEDLLRGYEIPAPFSLDEWTGWVMHLFDKIWLSRYDLYRLLAFWWSGRRLSAPK